MTGFVAAAQAVKRLALDQMRSLAIQCVSCWSERCDKTGRHALVAGAGAAATVSECCITAQSTSAFLGHHGHLKQWVRPMPGFKQLAADFLTRGQRSSRTYG